jgi:hypothetical protein
MGLKYCCFDIHIYYPNTIADIAEMLLLCSNIITVVYKLCNKMDIPWVWIRSDIYTMDTFVGRALWGWWIWFYNIHPNPLHYHPYSPIHHPCCRWWHRPNKAQTWAQLQHFKWSSKWSSGTGSFILQKLQMELGHREPFLFFFFFDVYKIQTHTFQFFFLKNTMM